MTIPEKPTAALFFQAQLYVADDEAMKLIGTNKMRALNRAHKENPDVDLLELANEIVSNGDRNGIKNWNCKK